MAPPPSKSNKTQNDIFLCSHIHCSLGFTHGELETRFSENNHVVLGSLISIIFDDKPSYESFRTVAEFYNLDEELLKADHMLLSHFKKNNVPANSASSQMFKILCDNETLALMPELSKAMQIYTVIPATSCSAERSFSTLRRLKTYLCSTM